MQQLQMQRIRKSHEQGGISVLLLCLVLVVLVVTVPLLYVGGALGAQEKLANAADLVAIGAANQFLSDNPRPCLTAKLLAARNGVELLQCQVQGVSVSVEVEQLAKKSFDRIGVGTLTAKAKAGL